MVEAVNAQWSSLPVLLVLGPLVAAALVYPLGRWRKGVRNCFVVLVSAATLLGATALIPLVAEHHRLHAELPLLLGRITFTVDSFSMLFAIFTAGVWLASTLYSLDYLTHEKKRDRYHTVNLVVLSAMLGVVLAGDLVTLYLFFEALGLVAYFFVVHTETDEAKRASLKYFWMTVVGGFLLIGGIFLTFALGGSGAIGPLPAGHGDEMLRWTAAILLIAGFGVKAGMVPVHVWLPDAHPVAPSPASALLSGVMIKAGAYGIFRVVTALFRPAVAEEIEESLWHFSSQLGLVVLWIGIATMFIGVVLALMQSNAKRMLAYHSVSQMGFILAGIGAAGYLGAHGAMGVAGGLYHVVNHALFKACLFLGVGAVYFRTHSLDMYHLGGLWKKMPLTFVFTLIAAAGITGVPLFNGFVSKCLIHHALVEAQELHGLVSLGIAEKIYIVTCGGTACSFIKLIGLVLLGAPKVEYSAEVRDAPPRMLIAMGGLGAAIVALGWFPQLLLKGVFQPGLHTWGLHSDILDHYLEVSFLSAPDLMSVVIAFAIGAFVFAVGMKTGLFHLKGPQMLSIDYWYGRAAHGLVDACGLTNDAYEGLRSATSRGLRRTRAWYRRTSSSVGRRWRLIGVTALTGAPGPRDQHFIQHAYLVLERERQHTVRAAVRHALSALPAEASADPHTRRAYLDAVRELAGYMSQRVFTARMGVISDLARKGALGGAVEPFDVVATRLRAARGPIAEAAVALAPRRVAGENVLRDVAITVHALLGTERLDLALAAESASEGQIERAFESVRSDGLSRVERAATWSVEMARTVVDALTRERAGWISEERLDEKTIVRTRLGIQRYARDIGLSIAVLVCVLLVFVVALFL
jgi:formate hydrogenlyase subunit 3/multisubunit Na+/H+ antiporter MnhD subunit